MFVPTCDKDAIIITGLNDGEGVFEGEAVFVGEAVGLCVGPKTTASDAVIGAVVGASAAVIGTVVGSASPSASGATLVIVSRIEEESFDCASKVVEIAETLGVVN